MRRIAATSRCRVGRCCLLDLLLLYSALIDPGVVLFRLENFRATDPSATFSALWTVQATVAGLLTRTVAFVALLLGRTGSKSLLYVTVYSRITLEPSRGTERATLVTEMGFNTLALPMCQLKPWLSG